MTFWCSGCLFWSIRPIQVTGWFAVIRMVIGVNMFIGQFGLDVVIVIRLFQWFESECLSNCLSGISTSLHQNVFLFWGSHISCMCESLKPTSLTWFRLRERLCPVDALGYRIRYSLLGLVWHPFLFFFWYRYSSSPSFSFFLLLQGFLFVHTIQYICLLTFLYSLGVSFFLYTFRRQILTDHQIRTWSTIGLVSWRSSYVRAAAKEGGLCFKSKKERRKPVGRIWQGPGNEQYDRWPPEWEGQLQYICNLWMFPAIYGYTIH